MIPPKKFGEVLTELIQSKHLSISTLGERTGGRAMLRRAMQDELNEAKCEWMYQRLCGLEMFSEDELHALRIGLEVSRMGVREYITKAALLNIMSGNKMLDGGAITNEEFCRRIEAAAASDTVRILCVNCCYPSLFNLLAPCFNSPDCDILMRHYIRLDRLGCDAASLIYCTAPILADSRYQPFSITYEAETQCFEGDFGIIHTQKGSRQSELFFLMKNSSEVYLLPFTAQLKLKDFAKEILDSINPKPAALKELNAPETGPTDMMMRYLALELNRATYEVTADFANMQIPPGISASALDDSRFERIGINETDANQIRKLLAHRYQNFYSKKKPHYQIVSYRGIERFLETGEKRGGLQGFRTFTPDERVRIIGDMLEKARTDPLYHLHIFKDMEYQVKYTSIGFEKLGISVFPGRISDNERTDSNYLFLTIPEFTKLFIKFYINTMIPDYCHDEAESLERLNELLLAFKAESGL